MGGGLDGYSWTEGIGLARLIAVFSNSGITGCTSVIPAIQWGEEKRILTRLETRWKDIYCYFLEILQRALTFFLLFVWRLKSNICFLSYYFCKFFTINYIIEYSINLSIKKNFFLKKFISSSLSRESFWKDVKKKGVLNIVRNIKFEISLKQNEILERINKTFESPCTFPVIQTIYTMNFPIKLRNYPTSVSLYAIGCTQG